MGLTGNLKRSVRIVRARAPRRHRARVLRSLWGHSDLDAPWLCWPAIDWLEAFMQPGMRVLEFGSGGSTVFFAKRGARVLSIEDDSAWHAEVQRRLGVLGLDGGRNGLECRVVPPEQDGESSTTVSGYEEDSGLNSHRRMYAGKTFRGYASSVDDLPDRSFDLALIDGRARLACTRHALPKIRPGGVLVLDNSERPTYEPIHALLAEAGAARTDFTGIGAPSGRTWSTTIYELPNLA